MRARAEICQCLPELSWGVVWGPRQGHGGMLRVAHCLCPPPPTVSLAAVGLGWEKVPSQWGRDPPIKPHTWVWELETSSCAVAGACPTDPPAPQVRVPPSPPQPTAGPVPSSPQSLRGKPRPSPLPPTTGSAPLSSWPRLSLSPNDSLSCKPSSSPLPPPQAPPLPTPPQTSPLPPPSPTSSPLPPPTPFYTSTYHLSSPSPAPPFPLVVTSLSPAPRPMAGAGRCARRR